MSAWRVQASISATVAVVRRGRPRQKQLLGDQAWEQRVHPVDRVADAHRASGVAVISTAQRYEPPPLRTAHRGLVLHRQLQSDLDRDRARVHEEHVLERRRRKRHELLGERHRRLVREAAEHHVAEAGRLLAERGVQHRMAVAVDRAPPRTHRVDRLEALPAGVLKLQADAVGSQHRVGRRSVQGGVRMPHQPAVAGDERSRRPGHGGHALGASSVPAPRRRTATSGWRSAAGSATASWYDSTRNPASAIISKSALADCPSLVR